MRKNVKSSVEIDRPCLGSTVDAALTDLEYMYLDCQTTGASPETGNLLEVAWCFEEPSSAFASSEPSIVSRLLLQPEGEKIPLRIQRITGITDDDLECAIQPAEVREMLLQSVEKLREPRLCIIHYSRFELPFLRALVPESKNEAELPFEPVCTFEIARRLYPNLPSRGIRALGGFLGVEMDEMKRAESHVFTTIVIWRHLVEKLGSEGIRTLGDLRSFLDAPPLKKRGRIEYPMEKLRRLQLPDKPGVYRMLGHAGKVLYVGKATSLKNRVNSHFRGKKKSSRKSMELLTQVKDIEVTVCGSPIEAALLECELIKRLDPPYNTALKSGDRRLAFYSRDFTSESPTQDPLHTRGPFGSTRLMDAVKAVSSMIQSGEPVMDLFFDEVDEQVMRTAISNFVERHEENYHEERRLEDSCAEERQTHLSDDDSTRFSTFGLLVLGMRLYRVARSWLGVLESELAPIASAVLEDEDSDHAQLEAFITEWQPPVSGIGQCFGSQTKSNVVHGVIRRSSWRDLERVLDLASEDEVGSGMLEFDEFEESPRKDGIETNSSPSETITDEEEVVTPEEVADRIEWILIEAARSYLLSRELTKLLECRVEFKHRKVHRELLLEDGCLITEDRLSKMSTVDHKRLCSIDSDESQGSSELSWQGLDLLEYDIVRVLYTECNRMQNEGKEVIINPRPNRLSRWQ